MLAIIVFTFAGTACNAPADSVEPEEAGGLPSAAASPAAAPPAAASSSTPAASPAPQKQFPPQDHLDKIVQAYTVANEYPELLTGLPCYCPCELYGHGGVIDCHRSQHAAMCAICMDEAIEAGQLHEAQLQRGVDDMAAVRAQVKNRYRRAIAAQQAQQLPLMNTQSGQAFLQVCSDCHQPPSPAMHASADWDPSLARMEQYARERNAMPPEPLWQQAVAYVKQVSAQVPASTVAEVRQGLAATVDHLKATEGDAAYYPSVRDDVLDPAWAERMAAAYAAARDLPTELLADTPTACEPCIAAGSTSLLACLNSGQAITCETAIEEVEALLERQSR